MKGIRTEDGKTKIVFRDRLLRNRFVRKEPIFLSI